MFRIIKSIYNTLYFNLKAFPLIEAIRFPVICGYRVSFKGIEKGKIEFANGCSFKRMTIGFSKGSFLKGQGQYTYVHIGGAKAKLSIADKCDVPCGSVLNVNGSLSIGKTFMPNSFLTISCENNIIIGDNCNIGWNVTIIDGDGHPLCDDNNPEKVINKSRPVVIGNNCWIAAHASIMKGVQLADNTTIPYGSIITKSCLQTKTVFGGSPNSILKENVVRQDYIKQ